MSAAHVLVVCRMVIVALFTLSAAGKLGALKDFELTIADFKLLPRRWSRAVAVLFVGAESAAALLVGLGGALLPAGLLLASALLATFTAALASVLYRKLDVSCHCFGRTERRVSPFDVVRNLLMLGASLGGLALVGTATQELAAGELVPLALMGGALVLLVLNLAEVVEALLRPLPVREGP